MPVTTIPASELHAMRQSGKACQIIDVRTPAEYGEVHADGATLVPLDQLDPAKVMQSRNGLAGEPLYVICKSGGRAAKACQKFIDAGFTNVISIEGGTDAWVKAGLPVIRGTRKVLSLERQVRIGAGLLVLIGVALGFLVHPALFGLSAFVGLGLIFAGLTDWCGMGMMLAKMPWNQGGPSCCSSK